MTFFISISFIHPPLTTYFLSIFLDKKTANRDFRNKIWVQCIMSCPQPSHDTKWEFLSSCIVRIFVVDNIQYAGLNIIECPLCGVCICVWTCVFLPSPEALLWVLLNVNLKRRTQSRTSKIGKKKERSMYPTLPREYPSNKPDEQEQQQPSQKGR